MGKEKEKVLLDEKDFEAIKSSKIALENVARSMNHVIQLAKERIDLFLSAKIEEKGLSLKGKSYSIDEKTREILEVRLESVNKEKNGKEENKSK